MFKVVAIATTGDRPKQLRQAVYSLLKQVDNVHVYDNSKNKDLGALAKFLYVDLFTEPVYYFTCDDDLIYPEDYIQRTIEEIEKNNCIISWHGRKLSPDATSYYGYPHQEEVRYFQEINEYKELDTGGTGVMGFRTDYFKPEISTLPYKVCADLTCGS